MRPENQYIDNRPIKGLAANLESCAPALSIAEAHQEAVAHLSQIDLELVRLRHHLFGDPDLCPGAVPKTSTMTALATSIAGRLESTLSNLENITARVAGYKPLDG